MDTETIEMRKVKALERIAQQIALLRADLREFFGDFEVEQEKETKKEAKRMEKKKTEKGRGFRGDAEKLRDYINQVCETLSEHLKDIDERKTAFYITIEHVDLNTFKQIAREVERKLDGKYSKSCHCFIVPREG